MKFSSFFYAFLILLISPIVALAANIELSESPAGDNKQILVKVDSDGEQTKSIKLTIEASEDITVSKIEEGDGFCSTFSSSPNGSLIEIMCTMNQDTILDGILAKIAFTSTSEDYTFKVLEDQSKIGDLSIDNVVNIGGEDVATASNELDTLEEGNEEESNVPKDTNEEVETTPAPAVSQTPGGAVVGQPKKENSIKKYLPYVLLGGAGIFLVSIIVLLVTKKKDDVVLADVPASTALVNAEATSEAETPQEVIPEPEQKPKLEDIIKPVDMSLPEEMGSQENTVPENSDLQELLASENTPVQADLSATDTMEAPSNFTSEIEDNYQANVSEDTLPNIGSTSPIDNGSAPQSFETNVLTQTETPNTIIAGEFNAPVQESVPQTEPVQEVSMTDQVNQFAQPTQFPIEETVQTEPMITNEFIQPTPPPIQETPVVQAEPIVTDELIQPTQFPTEEVIQPQVEPIVVNEPIQPTPFPMEETTQPQVEPVQQDTPISHPIDNLAPTLETPEVLPQNNDLQNMVNQEIDSMPTSPTPPAENPNTSFTPPPTQPPMM